MCIQKDVLQKFQFFFENLLIALQNSENLLNIHLNIYVYSNNCDNNLIVMQIKSLLI